MSGQHLKDLIKGHRYHDDALFIGAVQGLIDEEEAKKHNALANDLRRLLGPTATRKTNVAMPTDNDTRTPLGVVRAPNRELSDIVLTDDAAAEIRRVLAEVENFDLLTEAGLPHRRRLLLHGPPGCGKTTVVDGIAAALGRSVLVARADSLISSHLGQTAANLAKLFEFLDSGEYVLLIDEFDSLGIERGSKEDVGEMRRVVNTLLQLIEAYNGSSIIVAATNHVGVLDGAFWRRFDFVAEMPLPEREARIELLGKLVTAFGHHRRRRRARRAPARRCRVLGTQRKTVGALRRSDACQFR
jgi:SpoVK/Ycf46/Vps4 family AAA+-type ATPase